MLNLIESQWIPVRLRDGTQKRIAPWEIVDLAAGDAFDMPRPDFSGTILEFCIGLVQTCYAPESKRQWAVLHDKPPSSEALHEAMQAVAKYFNMFGERPLFMQDYTLQPRDVNGTMEVAALLIDSPGVQTQKFNGDVFIKRGGVSQLCPTCAAMALFTLQTYAPSGGAGHRTSMRGGGPLTTLVLGGTPWRTVWRNVRPLEAGESLPTPDTMAGSVFPWAAPTKTSEKKGSEFMGDQAHPYHAYWSMPRRILLHQEQTETPEQCSLCGSEATTMVREYWTKNYGHNYSYWRHPLTPYRDQGANEPLSIKGKSDGQGYNQWLGLLYGTKSTEKFPVEPSMNLVSFRSLARREGGRENIRAFGWDMDNMKPLLWCEAEYPMYTVAPEALPEFREKVSMLLEVADAVRRNLTGALKKGLFKDGGRNAKWDQTLLANATATFWSETRSAFFHVVEQITAAGEIPETLRWKWIEDLQRTSVGIFDRMADSGAFNVVHARQICEARKELFHFNKAKAKKVLGLEESGSHKAKGGKE